MQVIAEHPEQGRRGVAIEGSLTAIHPERNHSACPHIFA